MTDQGFEQTIAKLLSQDFSAGTETFRDSLLQRCLDVLAEENGMELDDEDLELLSAAGDMTSMLGEDPSFPGRNPSL